MMQKAMMAKRGRYLLEAWADDIHADFEDGGASLDNSNKCTLATKLADQNGPGLPGSVNTSPPTYKSVRESFSTPSHHTPREQQLGQSPKSVELPRRYHAESPTKEHLQPGILLTHPKQNVHRLKYRKRHTKYQLLTTTQQTTAWHHQNSAYQNFLQVFHALYLRPMYLTSHRLNQTQWSTKAALLIATAQQNHHVPPHITEPLRVNEPHPQSAYHPHQHQYMLNKRMRPASYR
ncbi:hypothetical protein BKA61DRAFT_705847 [Leptodontidium sp. MPI-SDFR-AT-0119]|nr:hypothetical protein BKA61DRAFT_705847 [Leptodontidium sp. MPI-SDFR-AT-0119]